MEALKDVDSFGYPVSLSYGDKKTNTHQTIFGGICTLLSRFCFLILFSYSFYKMFYFKDM